MVAQYLSELIEDAVEKKEITPEQLRELLPPYVIDAIAYVTSTFNEATPTGQQSAPLGTNNSEAMITATDDKIDA
jgi:putative ATP-dependent endonuclease of OLD family